MYDFPTYLPEKLSQFLTGRPRGAPYYPKNTLQITNAILPCRRQPAAEAEDGVDAGTGKEEDDQGLHDGMGDPAALPTRFLVAVFPGTAQHEDGQDGHDDAAEGAGAEDGVDEADEAAVGQEDRRDDDEGQAGRPRADIRFRLEAQAVDHVGQEAFGNGPERRQHGTEGEGVDDDEEDRRPQGAAPG